jgi:hypothetical protein
MLINNKTKATFAMLETRGNAIAESRVYTGSAVPEPVHLNCLAHAAGNLLSRRQSRSTN